MLFLNLILSIGFKLKKKKQIRGGWSISARSKLWKDNKHRLKKRIADCQTRGEKIAMPRESFPNKTWDTLFLVWESEEGKVRVSSSLSYYYCWSLLFLV